MIRALVFLSLLVLHAEPNPHPTPQLKDLYKPWVFTRASEASTLFIETHHKGAEPYAHVVKTEGEIYWFEFDGKTSQLWEITDYTEDAKELTLNLKDGGKVVVFPYWDIDQCLIMIRFQPNADENPTRFATPYYYLSTLDYMDGE